MQDAASLLLFSFLHTAHRSARSAGQHLLERFDLERCFLSNLHISTAPPEEQPDCPGARISAEKLFKKYMQGEKRVWSSSAEGFAEGHVV